MSEGDMGVPIRRGEAQRLGLRQPQVVTYELTADLEPLRRSINEMMARLHWAKANHAIPPRMGMLPPGVVFKLPPFPKIDLPKLGMPPFPKFGVRP